MHFVLSRAVRKALLSDEADERRKEANGLPIRQRTTKNREVPCFAHEGVSNTSFNTQSALHGVRRTCAVCKTLVVKLMICAVAASVPYGFV